MTVKTFNFTIEQIKEIYQAGIRRGSDEQCAYDWGTRASGGEYDECIEVIHTIVNEGKDVWDDPDYSDWKVIESWFKETK